MPELQGNKMRPLVYNDEKRLDAKPEGFEWILESKKKSSDPTMATVRLNGEYR